MIKKRIIVQLLTSMYVLSAHADVQADWANFCAEDEFSTPVSYVAIKDTNSLGMPWLMDKSNKRYGKGIKSKKAL
jgi:hypothetical protein